MDVGGSTRENMGPPYFGRGESKNQGFRLISNSGGPVRRPEVTVYRQKFLVFWERVKQLGVEFSEAPKKFFGPKAPEKIFELFPKNKKNRFFWWGGGGAVVPSCEKEPWRGPHVCAVQVLRATVAVGWERAGRAHTHVDAHRRVVHQVVGGGPHDGHVRMAPVSHRLGQAGVAKGAARARASLRHERGGGGGHPRPYEGARRGTAGTDTLGGRGEWGWGTRKGGGRGPRGIPRPPPPCASTATVPKNQAKQRFNAHPVLRQDCACVWHT